jgi:hypothetical protein
MFASHGTYYLQWCRDPANAAQADPEMPVSVTCPANTTATNYSADPTNMSYRIASETYGLDRTRITFSTPLCGAGPAAPTVACAPPGATKPKYVLITASYRLDLLTPILSNIWGTPVNITATALARVDP